MYGTMIDFDKRNVIFEGTKYNMKGLNTQQVACHLSEIYKPERFISNLKNNYNISNYMNIVTLVEGTKFDALLVDDKMFRFTKLDESVKDDIYDCINRGAYGTALLKLNESSNIMGSGLNHNFKLNESYDFVSKSMESLFINSYLTSEKGKLIESFGKDVKVNLYEGNEHFIKGNGEKRLVEDWKNPFNINDVEDYSIKNVSRDGNSFIVNFVNEDGIEMETIFEDADIDSLNIPTINYSDIFKRNKIVSSYRVGKLNEYHQPFSINKAAFLSIELDGKMLNMVMLDEYGNKASINAELKISEKEFHKKYDKDIKDLNSTNDWYAKYTISEFIMEDLEYDVVSFSKAKNLSREDVGLDSYNKVSYKVHGFIPEGDFCKEHDIDLVQRHPKNKDCFWVRVTDGNRQYSLIFRYDDEEPLSDFLDYINSKVDTDAWDFGVKQDVNAFYSELSSAGTPLKTYPLNISSAGRKIKKEESVMEGEGVQVSDIAPKVDQEVGLIKVKMKRRKKNKVEESDNFNINDLLINTINEEDEFYGARGFIKDELGRYHFNDYYINESGRVVHKSRLDESTFRDLAGKSGIHSYFDMLYGEEPQSEYDKAILEYMHKMDDLSDRVEETKSKFYNKEISEDEFNKACEAFDNEQLDLLAFRREAEEIPVEDRGPLYQDYLEIERQNEDDFYKTHVDYLGLHESIDPVLYVDDENADKDSELYKLSVEYKKIFDEMCKYNGQRRHIYPGFDEDKAKDKLSSEDYEKYKELSDKYYSLRLELRKVGEKIDAIQDQ